MPSSAKRAPLAAFTAVIFRTGNFVFGGGNATIAVLQREFFRRGWFDDSDFALCYALARITPGTNMFAFYTASGWLLRGWAGAVLALLVGSIPCCLLVSLLTAGFDRVSANIWVQRGISGALAAAVGILLASFWLLVRPQFTGQTKSYDLFRNSAILGGSIALSLYAGLSPVTVLILAAAAGFLGKSE